MDSRGDLEEASQVQFPRATKSAHAVRRVNDDPFLLERSIAEEDVAVSVLEGEYNRK